MILLYRHWKNSDWTIFSNPTFEIENTVHYFMNQILISSLADYVEYHEGGIFYRVIYDYDLENYSISE